MERNAIREAADRLGFLAYLSVVGGGVPYWSALSALRSADSQEAPAEHEEAQPPRRREVLPSDVAIERETERTHVAAAA